MYLVLTSPNSISCSPSAGPDSSLFCSSGSPDCDYNLKNIRYKILKKTFGIKDNDQTTQNNYLIFQNVPSQYFFSRVLDINFM